MAKGDEVRDQRVTFEVVWAGGRQDFSLLGDYPRPSALADLVPDMRQSYGRHYVSRRDRDGRGQRHARKKPWKRDE